jgi:tetraprenyl-beta-curcumene synthase
VGSAIREVGAAASALGAYLTTVLPRARRELRALGPLPPGKKANAEAVAVFAILAPRAQRATVVRAIIALQVQIDLLDAAEEEGFADSQEFGERIIRLDERWLGAAVSLPSWQVVKSFLEEAIKRCERGQIQTHRAAREGPEQLRDWARRLETSPSFRWWEIAAGASSSAAVHALIAAAADSAATQVDAAGIDVAYQPPVGALTVFLDDLVDHDEDLADGQHNYLGYYADSEEAAERMGVIAGRAEELLRNLPNSNRHRAILAGVAGFYLSAPGAETSYAQPIRERLLETLGPGVRLLAGFMRIRRLGERKRPEQVGNSPGP